MSTATLIDNTKAFASALKWRDHYRSLGYQPLPSRMDEKRPLIYFSDFWAAPLPDDAWASVKPTTNLQLMTGRHWGLLVIDLDGPEAIEAWSKIGQPRKPRTWVTHSGGGGEHWWFTVPRNGPGIAKAELWRSDPSKPRVKGESAIERLCDGSLVMAPPSIHPRTGQHYRFRSKGECPTAMGLRRPAPCPAWLLSMPALVPPREMIPFTPKPHVPPGERKGSAMPRFDRSEVIASIGDKIALARSWGLRIANERPSANGWVACHSIARQDSTPSAGFHVHLGTYVDHGQSREKLSLFDLGVALGHYEDWSEAKDALGSIHCPWLQKSREEQERSPGHESS